MPLTRAFHYAAPLALGLLVGACGSPEAASTEREADGAPAAAPARPAAAADDRNAGTLRIGEVAYRFDVLACDLGGEADEGAYQTLSGRGHTADGERFQVTVSRTEVGGMLVHTVSFANGDVLRGEGEVLEARRMRHGEQWIGTGNEPAEPLVRIDGTRVTATGRFGPPEDEAPTRPGSLEASC